MNMGMRFMAYACRGFCIGFWWSKVAAVIFYTKKKQLRRAGHGIGKIMDTELIQQRVLVIGDGSLLSEGVTKILEQQPHLLISGTPYLDYPPFVNIAEWVVPDVILVCDAGSVELGRVFYALSAQQLVIGLMIIVVGMANNMIDVYPNASFVDGRIHGRPRKVVPMTQRDLINLLNHNYQQ
jgi:hypothetical protein